MNMLVLYKIQIIAKWLQQQSEGATYELYIGTVIARADNWKMKGINKPIGVYT